MKKKPKEFPKLRIIILIGMIVLFISTLIMFGMPAIPAFLLGLFSGGLFYYLFVVIRVQKLIQDILFSPKEEETMAHEKAKTVVEQVEEEGIVLLKNEDRLLPLTAGAKLNLLGLRCVQMNYNGGGSASSDESTCVRLEEALREEGFIINNDLIALSVNYLKDESVDIKPLKENYRVKSGNSQKGGAEFVKKPGSPVKSEIPVSVLNSADVYDDGRTVLEHGADFSDIALIVLSRGGGEGYELDPVDLRLIESEKHLIEEACNIFENVILLLNMINPMEMDWIDNYPQIKSVLWIGFPGETGNRSVARILNGSVCPSGHLSDIWLKNNMYQPAVNNYLEILEDGSFAKESFHYRNAPDKRGYFVKYSEGIYNGYRYFETRDEVDEAFDYNHMVMWPFGFGLSYTAFSSEICGLNDADDVVFLDVEVQNIGECEGKHLIQIYMNPPYTGKVERSTANLVAFKKTKLLKPGESAKYHIEIPYTGMNCFNIKTGKWMLERGSYVFSVNRDSHTKEDAITWNLVDDICFDGTVNLFSDAYTKPLDREFASTHPAFTGPAQEDFIATADVLDALDFSVPQEIVEEVNICENSMSASNRDTSLNYSAKAGKRHIYLTDLIGKSKGDKMWDELVSRLTGPEICDLCGNGAWQIKGNPRIKAPRILTPDGSTSVSATVFSAMVMGKWKKGVTWPSPTVLAATFNEDLAVLAGDSIGAEAWTMGYAGWYAPAMNIHRTAYNSRNFEYYSEDPLLSGKMAANVVKHVQKQGVITFIKHFALNERETNARNQLFTWCDEQTMREIYLKPFEIAVKEGGAYGIMSSFNYIGHVWAGGNRNLLTELLRKEWGFEGVVITDACMYPHMDVVQMLYAGGDMALDSLGGFTGGNIKRRVLLAGYQDSEYRKSMDFWLSRSAKNIMYVLTKTWKMMRRAD